MSTADWRYQTYLKNIVFFYVSCWDFSQGWKSLYNTIIYMIKQVLTFAYGLGIATKGTCYKETFPDKIKKKQKLWKSLSVIALSSFLGIAISLKEIYAH